MTRAPAAVGRNTRSATGNRPKSTWNWHERVDDFVHPFVFQAGLQTGRVPTAFYGVAIGTLKKHFQSPMSPPPAPRDTRRDASHSPWPSS